MGIEAFNTDSKKQSESNDEIVHARKVNKDKYEKYKSIADACPRNICYTCGSQEGLEDHHISYYPEITIPLCKDCHHTVHHGDDLDGLEPINSRPVKTKILPRLQEMIHEEIETIYGKRRKVYEAAGTTTMKGFIEMAIRDEIKKVKQYHEVDDSEEYQRTLDEFMTEVDND